jgi:2-polyprenyl-6-methoxyphenol hydroxylase-like FAD-dependent oxidoreductase
VASSRTVIIAGAGIGGLTAALAIAARGFRVALYEQAQTLQEVGAGIQLSPNAAHVLIGLGLQSHLQPYLVAPEDLRIVNARTERVLARAPLGSFVEKRYGAPYWLIHRGDLQAALVEAVRSNPDITLTLGWRIDDFADHQNGITVSMMAGHRSQEERGLALVGADGLWSRLRERLGHRDDAHFARHTAWRALASAEAVAPELREPSVNLWLGRHAHLVHYPVRGGQLINMVAIIRDDWQERGWSAAGERAEILDHYPAGMWPARTRALLAAPKEWRKWALHDRAPIMNWGKGPATLLGDAAHPMLPFLAQGAAMAIEDAAVLADRLGRSIDAPATAFRRYERDRQRRTARVQKSARRNGTIYHMGGAEAFLRGLALMAMGGNRVIKRYDWLYGWKPP